MMSAEETEKRDSVVLTKVVSWATAGVDPAFMGIGPVPGWTLVDVDLIEANEASAAQALSVGKELGWEADKVNVNGGAIAIGHRPTEALRAFER